MKTIVENSMGKAAFDEKTQMLYLNNVEVPLDNWYQLRSLLYLLEADASRTGGFDWRCECFFMNCSWSGEEVKGLKSTQVCDRMTWFLEDMSEDEYNLLLNFVWGYYFQLYPFCGKERAKGRAVVVAGCDYAGAKSRFVESWALENVVRGREFLLAYPGCRDGHRLSRQVTLQSADPAEIEKCERITDCFQNNNNLVIDCEGSDAEELDWVLFRLQRLGYEVSLLWVIACCPVERCVKKERIFKVMTMQAGGWDLRLDTPCVKYPLPDAWLVTLPAPELLCRDNFQNSVHESGITVQQIHIPVKYREIAEYKAVASHIRNVRDSVSVMAYPCDRVLRDLAAKQRKQ